MDLNQPPGDRRPRVTVLGGFSPAATAAVTRSLLVTDPHLLLVDHRTAPGDLGPALARLARTRPGSDILLALPAQTEPAEIVAAAAGAGDAVRFDSYLTVVEAARFLDDLTSIDDLCHRGLDPAGTDHRAVADVVSRQVEHADTVVVWGSPRHDHRARARLDALLHRLAPWATQVRIGDAATVDCTALADRLLRTGRHDPAIPGMRGRALEGFPVGIHDPAGEAGVNAMLFRARRPFHPERLHDALADLAGATLRGRGQLWLAGRPDTVVGWESAGGGVQLHGLGPWLAALPRDRWTRASDLRRLAADLDWDPYYGDRRTVLSFVGLRLDVPALTDRLAGCLLTDPEIADGVASWARLADPFDGFFPATEEVSA